MEVRRAADAILRSQSFPLASFFSPSTALRWQPGRQLSCRGPNSRPVQRGFITTARRLAINQHPTTSATPLAPPPAEEESIEDVAKSLNWVRRGASAPGNSRITRFDALGSNTDDSSPSAERRERNLNGGHTADEILRVLNEKVAARASSNRIDIGRMLDPKASRSSETLNVMRELGQVMAPPKQVRIPMRLSPSTGRTVAVAGGVDIGRALRMLEFSCSRNGVRADAKRQRFHERPGMKRKRLKRERWRKKFMDGFKATIARVKELHGQGW